MGVTLCRTGFSPNIKERLDYSCAVFDAAGDTIAQGDHMPVHLGAMPLSVRAAIDALPMEPGDIVMLNDPFHGGTHLPDITLVSPVFLGTRDRRPTFYVANRAHHSDVGGMSPGSMPVAREIYQEGLILPPVQLARRGTHRSRRPGARPRQRAHAGRARGRSDGADRRQPRRRRRGCATRSRATAARRTLAYAAALQDYTERVRPRRDSRRFPTAATRSRTRSTTTASATRRCRFARRRRSRATARRSTSPARRRRSAGSVNANYAMTLSACLYAFRCLVGDDVLYNAGVARAADGHRAGGLDRQRAPAGRGRRRQRRDVAAHHRRRASARSARRCRIACRRPARGR